jgi:hypothetical protein
MPIEPHRLGMQPYSGYCLATIIRHPPAGAAAVPGITLAK